MDEHKLWFGDEKDKNINDRYDNVNGQDGQEFVNDPIDEISKEFDQIEMSLHSNPYHNLLENL